MKCPNKGVISGHSGGEKYTCDECGRKLILISINDSAFVPAHERLKTVYSLTYINYNTRANKHGELPSD